MPRTATSEQSISCHPAQAAQGGMTGVARIMYPKLDETLKRNEQDGCARSRHDDDERAARLRAEAVTAVGATFSKLGSLGPQGICTAIYQVAARALARSSHVIALTDAQQTCGWYERKNGSVLSFTVPQSSSLLFLVVPAASGRDVSAAIVRAGNVQAVFPEASIVLLNEATPVFWRQLGLVAVK